jgi:hypothetical protein
MRVKITLIPAEYKTRETDQYLLILINWEGTILKKAMLLSLAVIVTVLPLFVACSGGAAPAATPQQTAAPQPSNSAPVQSQTPAAKPSATPSATSAAPAASTKPVAAIGPSIPHTLTGRTDCNLCHGPSGTKPYPADHAGRTNDTCTNCHKPQ